MDKLCRCFIVLCVEKRRRSLCHFNPGFYLSPLKPLPKEAFCTFTRFLPWRRLRDDLVQGVKRATGEASDRSTKGGQSLRQRDSSSRLPAGFRIQTRAIIRSTLGQARVPLTAAFLPFHKSTSRPMGGLINFSSTSGI